MKPRHWLYGVEYDDIEVVTPGRRNFVKGGSEAGSPILLKEGRYLKSLGVPYII